MPAGSEYKVKGAYDEEEHADDNYGGNDEVWNTSFHNVSHDRVDEKYLEPLAGLAALK